MSARFVPWQSDSGYHLPSSSRATADDLVYPDEGLGFLRPMTAPELLFDGPAGAPWTLILAHGAGQGMRSRFMTAFAEGLAARGKVLGGLRVARFEFPYMAARAQTGRQRPPDREPVLLESWRSVIARLEREGFERRRLVVGGKSLGGRMASLIADEQQVAGLVCLGYPFHPPGKSADLRRIGHLKTIVTPTLICQGSRDPFGSREEVASYTLSPAIVLCWLEDGDHGFKPRKSAGPTESDHWNTAMDAVVDFVTRIRLA